MAAVLLAGCTELPPVEYTTPRLELATGFDAPVCEGTLDSLDAHLERVEQTLGLGLGSEPIRMYWLSESETEDVCGGGNGGCFFPATRVVFGQGSSLTHELVHAALDTRGESSFLEEGMAEMLSGVGAYYDPRTAEASIAEHISVSRSEYRDGGVDYAAAGHFVRWVFEQGGTPALVSLAEELDRDASMGEISKALQETMSDSMDGISERYRNDAPTYYRGLDQSGVKRLWWKALAEGVEIELDCDDVETRGPLRDDEPGQYRVFWVKMPTDGLATVHVSGAPDAFVELIDPRARLRRGLVQDWTQPDPRFDPGAHEVEVGPSQPLAVRKGEYLVVVGTRSIGPAVITLGLTPPPTRSARVPKRN